MKKLGKLGFLPLLLPLLLIVLIMTPILILAAQPTVNLGTTSSYAVLAGSTITNTGPTTITGSSPEGGGNVGLYPGTSFTGQADVTMTGWTANIANEAARLAKEDLQTAYDDAAGRTPVTRIATELGAGNILNPGVYDSASGKFGITGTLTLDAHGDPNAVFIFKTASTLITASNSNINLINGARFCRVFWQVGSSATLGTDSHFVGHIFAQSDITANTRASIQGQLLALRAVTLDTNTIANALCNDIEPTTDETTTDETTTGETTTGETTTGETTTGETTTGETTTGETTTGETTTGETTTGETTTGETTTGVTTTGVTTTGVTTTSVTTTGVTTTGVTTTGVTIIEEGTTTVVDTMNAATTSAIGATTAPSATNSITSASTTIGVPQTGGSSGKMLALVLTSSLILAGTVYALRRKSAEV